VGRRADFVLDRRRRIALVEFTILPGGQKLKFEPQALIIAGFTGRNRAKVQEHIDEMREHGVPIPDSTPTFYPVPTSLLTIERNIDVRTAESSGEVEPVLVAAGNDWYITLGSDHTARDQEKTDIAQSKAACPKILCTQLWRYADLRPHWDRLTLSGWASAMASSLARWATGGEVNRRPRPLGRSGRVTTSAGRWAWL